MLSCYGAPKLLKYFVTDKLKCKKIGNDVVKQKNEKE